MHSGCTAVTAFLRIEDMHGNQSFLPDGFFQSDLFTNASVMVGSKHHERGRAGLGGALRDMDMSSSSMSSISDDRSGDAMDGITDGTVNDKKKKNRGSRLLDALKGRSSSSRLSMTSRRSGNASETSSLKSGRLSSSGASTPTFTASSSRSSPSPTLSSQSLPLMGKKLPGAISPLAPTSGPAAGPLRRVLYTANAGDARAVLCRAGKAVRLTYDHKGSDKQEAKRITDAGGFVMGGRVNGTFFFFPIPLLRSKH